LAAFPSCEESFSRNMNTSTASPTLISVISVFAAVLVCDEVALTRARAFCVCVVAQHWAGWSTPCCRTPCTTCAAASPPPAAAWARRRAATAGPSCTAGSPCGSVRMCGSVGISVSVCVYAPPASISACESERIQLPGADVSVSTCCERGEQSPQQEHRSGSADAAARVKGGCRFLVTPSVTRAPPRVRHSNALTPDVGGDGGGAEDAVANPDAPQRECYRQAEIQIKVRVCAVGPPCGVGWSSHPPSGQGALK